MKNSIEVKIIINKDVDFVWEMWTNPNHITKWNFATDEWCCPFAENDLKPGGKFSYRMEAKDGSMGFDFNGTYNEIDKPNKILYTLGDDRKTEIVFSSKDGSTEIKETFEAEGSNPVEMQAAGWQSILNNFKRYVESTK